MDGRVSVRCEGDELLSGKLEGVLETMPLDGLQVGRDLAGNVGEYDGDFPYDGTIEEVVLTIDK